MQDLFKKDSKEAGEGNFSGGGASYSYGSPSTEEEAAKNKAERQQDWAKQNPEASKEMDKLNKKLEGLEKGDKLNKKLEKLSRKQDALDLKTPVKEAAYKEVHKLIKPEVKDHEEKANNP